MIKKFIAERHQLDHPENLSVTSKYMWIAFISVLSTIAIFSEFEALNILLDRIPSITVVIRTTISLIVTAFTAGLLYLYVTGFIQYFANIKNNKNSNTKTTK